MGAQAIGLVDFGSDAAWNRLPSDLFEIADEFATTRIDEDVRLTGGTAEAAVDTVDAVAHDADSMHWCRYWPGSCAGFA